jgi:hypothetical protein
MRLVAIMAAVVLPTAAVASPPPPPPEYVTHATEILTSDWNAAQRPEFAALFGNDVVAYVDGKRSIIGKIAWLALERETNEKFHRRVEGFARSSLPSAGDSGDLLILDEIDPIRPYGDPRWSTRSILYQFGRDGLIHTVRITEVHGFLEPAPRG